MTQEPPDYAPSASIETLRRRAALLAETRAFFAERGVLEVETPLLCAAGVVDEHLEPIRVVADQAVADQNVADQNVADFGRYLVTSPEHNMKRLLAAGSGAIYQITRSFRRGERGRLHNPEFTILEWYRPGWDHFQLMTEVEELFARLLDVSERRPFARTAYRDAFEHVLGLDPLGASDRELAEACAREGIASPARSAAGIPSDRRDDLLNLLLATRVEPELGVERPEFLIDYPASQAALARLSPGDPRVAERFELYIRGVELANGYHELVDRKEQEARFRKGNELRAARGKSRLPIDERFLAALAAGMPAASGVAVGFDRLVMLSAGAASIDEVMAFPAERA